MNNNNKHQPENFTFTTAGQSVPKEITLDKSYKRIKGIGFHCPTIYPANASIESFSVEGVDDMFGSGIYVGNFMALDKPMFVECNIELKGTHEVRVTLKDRNATLATGYTVQITFELEK